MCMGRDVVEAVELAGVQLSWLRERGAAAGHFVVLAPTHDEEAVERGPYSRSEARLAFEAMSAALLSAARQQTARLRSLMPR